MKTFNKILYSLILATILFIGCQNNDEKANKQVAIGPIGDSAMVSSAHPLATEAGVEILRKGGNAIDAAVAVHFVLQVVFPEAGNIAGGGFAVIRENDGNISSLDFREKAPLKAHRDMYLDSLGNADSKKSRLGHLAAGVPGSVAGVWELHQKKGKLAWGDLLEPAIKIASEGYKLSDYGAENLNEDQEEFKEANNYTPWVINENSWKAGDYIVQKELANTLTIIQKNGKDGFYKGEIANKIIDEMKKGKGLITKEDLEKYQPVWRNPLVGNYKNHKIITMPPPSSGGIALLQLLHGAEYFNLSSLKHNSATFLHYKTEIERRVYADRATYLGDPDFYNVPQEKLISKEYNNERFSTIKKDAKTPSSEIKEGKVDIIESVETTHYSIVDLEGNAVAVTTTLNGFYGCKVMVKGTGFFLNNEMDDFSAKPGVPNMFGLVGGEANSIVAEKRMLSSMTPTIVEKDNKLFMVTGSPGGSTIITSVFQSIINVIDFNMGMQEAIDSKKSHSQWLPDVILVENNTISKEDSLQLVAWGHIIENRESWGRVDAILVRDSVYEGGDDNRGGDDFANGF